jgi:hypothetical protein
MAALETDGRYEEERRGEKGPTARPARLRARPGRRAVPVRAGTKPGCRLAGFSVPFEVSSVCSVCRGRGGRKLRPFVNHLQSVRIVCFI